MQGQTDQASGEEEQSRGIEIGGREATGAHIGHPTRFVVGGGFAAARGYHRHRDGGIILPRHRHLTLSPASRTQSLQGLAQSLLVVVYSTGGLSRGPDQV